MTSSFEDEVSGALEFLFDEQSVQFGKRRRG
jgi:hypothetical protein